MESGVFLFRGVFYDLSSFSLLTLEAPTPQNDPTHPNNSSASLSLNELSECV